MSLLSPYLYKTNLHRSLFHVYSFIVSVAKNPNTVFATFSPVSLGHVSGFLQPATAQMVMCSGRSAFTQETKHDFGNHAQY